MVGTMLAIGLAIAAVSTTAQVVGQLKQGKAAETVAESEAMGAELQAQQSEYNAGVAALQADDAIARGKDEEARFRTSVKGLIGSQRVGFAAGGVNVGSGSAVDVQADTAYQGELDARTIRSNAQREAWGFGVQAENMRQTAAVQRQGGEVALRAGASAKKASKLNAIGTIAGAGSSLLLSRYGWSG